MHIGICDDEEYIRRLIRRYIEDDNQSDESYLFGCSTDVKRHLEGGRPLDVLFLDIDLKDTQDGMSLAKELKKNAIDEGMGSMTLPLIIFVTGYPDRMQEAFSVRAFHFLLKPVNEEVFKDILDQARKTVGVVLANHNNRTITFSNDGVTFSLRMADIDYVESLGRKLVFHTKSQTTEVYGKISDIAQEFGDSFYQIHRSYVVNMNRIFDYSKREVTLESGEKIPLSKYKHDEFVRAYAAFLGRQSL